MSKITLGQTFRSWLELWQSLQSDLNAMFTELFGYDQLSYKILASDVINNNATPNTLQDITGLSFPVLAGKTYYFYAMIPYTAAVTTTGSRWTVNGPSSPTNLHYTSRYPLTTTTETFNYATAYQVPAGCNTDSMVAGNVATIEGYITPSVDGIVTMQFASEITASAITAKAGAKLQYQRIL